LDAAKEAGDKAVEVVKDVVKGFLGGIKEVLEKK